MSFLGTMNPLQGMFQQLLLPQTKRISPEAGIITRKLHKWRMNDFADIALAESRAIESQVNSFTLMMNVFEQMATFSDRIKLQFLESEHKKNKMTLDEKEKQAVVMGIMLDNEIKQGKIKHMDIEYKLAELEFRVKSKEMESLLNGGCNGSLKTENRVG
jgi:hypothetical protein